MTRARDVANLIGSGNFSSTTFTATAGQTAFTISHTQGFIQVFMNGLLLDETVDYTSNGSAVTLTSGAAAGDEIEVVAYNTFSVGDALNQAAADTRYVNATGDTMTGNLGIGASPSQRLHVEGTGNQFILLNNSSTNDGMYLKAGTGASSIQTNGGSHVLNFFTSGTERMKIDSSGVVTTPYQPAIEFSGPAITPANATWTKFDLDSNVLSRGGMSLDTTNDRITVPATGYYLVNYWIMVNMSTNSSSVRALGVRLYKNGSIFNSRNYWSGHRFTTGVLTTHDSATGHFLVNCTANDYLELYMIGYDTTTGIVFQPYITVTFQG